MRRGGDNWRSVVNAQMADARAERLRRVMAELADLSSRAAAAELNKRMIETPQGKRWHPMTVSRLRARLPPTRGSADNPRVEKPK